MVVLVVVVMAMAVMVVATMITVALCVCLYQATTGRKKVKERRRRKEGKAWEEAMLPEIENLRTQVGVETGAEMGVRGIKRSVVLAATNGHSNG